MTRYEVVNRLKDDRRIIDYVLTGGLKEDV